MPPLREPAAVVLPAEDADAIAAMAERTIAKGSQSFAAAARLFDPVTRQGAMMLYAWCRHCDDVIDDQDLGHNRTPGTAALATPESRISALEDLTRRAFAGEALADPNFRALQIVARRHALPLGLALDHLAGFRMDVEGRRYASVEDMLDYCHHVAGVVGVMMAHIMLGAAEPAGPKGPGMAETLQHAADLGLAFQLSNIARDIVPDALAGRVYLPADWLAEVSLPVSDIADPANRRKVALLAARLVALAEPYYASARIGIDALPRRSAWAVATAHGVYREIGLRVVRLGERAWDARVSTSKADKLVHVVRAGVIAARWRGKSDATRPLALWRHS